MVVANSFGGQHLLVLQVERVYNISVPNSERRLPTASQMLAAFAKARGWTTGAGLPDEARAGRQVR